MATARDHADAYLAQASEDLVAAKALVLAATKDPGLLAPSVLAMLLQMTFEKLAKAALLRNGSTTVEAARATHKAASRLVSILRRNRGLLHPLGGDVVWQDVLTTVPELERAHPQLAEPTAPRLEYPWEDNNGTVRWPARDLAVAHRLVDPTSTRGSRMIRFASKLIEHFDDVFP